jgi:hypothetical protein
MGKDCEVDAEKSAGKAGKKAANATAFPGIRWNRAGRSTLIGVGSPMVMYQHIH